MKTVINIIILSLTFCITSNGQDTIAKMVAGKKYFEFDYSTSEIINKIKKKKFKDIKINIKNNQVLYLDLYDKCKCNDFQDMSKSRNITIFYRNGVKSTNTYDSGDYTFKVNGKEIQKIIISKPILKEVSTI